MAEARSAGEEEMKFEGMRLTVYGLRLR